MNDLRFPLRSLAWLSGALGLGLTLVPATASAAVWGGFDETRLNYPGGVLATGVDHDELRTLIMANGDTVAAPTGTLDAAYLAGVDVFYTSLLQSGGPVLSAAEQTALVNWVDGGGTLIATGGSSSGYFPPYEAFTSPFGVTPWSTTGGSTATVVAVHPLTAGVANLDPNAHATFGFGMGATELAVDDLGATFMVVLDPDTGFCDSGRVLVLGDHNLFDDNTIALADNTLLAQNMVEWAAAPFGCSVCGNSIVEPTEDCDDGNLDDTDACLSTCVSASCGDGFVWAGMEDCDDANGDDTDACPGTCMDASCGDGFVWAGMEECDDGNADDTDECPGSCMPATCGDGYTWAGMEECDDGNAVQTDACLSTCVAASCGDGFVNEGVEECDDGNLDDDDGCSSACLLESGGSTGDPTGGSDDAADSTGGSGGGSGPEPGDDSSGGEGSSGGIGSGSGGSGATGGSDDGGGCACTSGERRSPLPWVLGLIMLGLRRRRRP